MIQWSQEYFTGLTYTQHMVNNQWFDMMLSQLKDDGTLFVPILQKTFNKQGEEQ